ncbi:MAG: tetratricopeptide repeat protein [Candidatus Methylomirabilis sp.]|nr:tetratricopeptide repeat protein [Candidatus Methylomirabilis sp.]
MAAARGCRNLFGSACHSGTWQVRKKKNRSLQVGQSGNGGYLPSLLAILLLLAVVAAVYANSLQNEFLFDDLETIVELHSPGGSGPLGPLHALLSGRGAYRPVRSASYALDYAVSGLEPWGYHLVNIALHAGSTVLVFLIARGLFDRLPAALLTALLFAVHPIQTDAVTYLSGRRDVLSGLFVLGGFYAFLRYRGTGRAAYLVLAIALYPLAFLSKESGIILPLLCVGYDIYRRVRVHHAGDTARESLRAILTAAWAAIREGRRLYLPLAVLAGGFAAYVLLFVRGTWQQSYHGGSLAMTLLTMSRVVLHYLGLLAFPLRLNADYSYNAFPVTDSWTDPWAWAALLVLAGLGYGWLFLVARRPLAAFGGAWFALALLPVSQIVPHHELMAEHYLYTPSVGFCLLLVGLLEPALAERQSSRVVFGAAALVLVLFSLRTVTRNTDWRDELTLWRKTVQTAPQSARARNNLGAAYLRRGELALAQAELEAATRIRPDFSTAHGNLGKLHLDRGELASARTALEAALALRPNEMIPRLWLGAVLLREGRVTEAEAQFQAAMSNRRSAPYARNNLGVLAARQGRFEEAAAAFREALRMMPELAEARTNLARLADRRDRMTQSAPSGAGARP